MFLLLLRDRFDVLWPGDEERWRGKRAHRQGGDSFVFSSTHLWQERRRQPPGQGGKGLQAGSGGSCLSSACSCSCSHAHTHKDAVLDRMNAELAGSRDRISALELQNKELLQEKLDLHASVASFRNSAQIWRSSRQPATLATRPWRAFASRWAASRCGSRRTAPAESARCPQPVRKFMSLRKRGNLYCFAMAKRSACVAFFCTSTKVAGQCQEVCSVRKGALRALQRSVLCQEGNGGESALELSSSFGGGESAWSCV